jgi:hypothetical protein
MATYIVHYASTSSLSLLRAKGFSGVLMGSARTPRARRAYKIAIGCHLLHPLSWDGEKTPAERFTGLDSESIWQIARFEAWVVLKHQLGGYTAGTVLSTDDAQELLSEDADAADSGPRALMYLLETAGGDPKLRDRWSALGLAPTQLLNTDFVFLGHGLWEDASSPWASSQGQLLKRMEPHLARLTIPAAPVMARRHEIDNLHRVILAWYDNGRRGLFTHDDGTPFTSLRTLLTRHLPWLDIEQAFAEGQLVDEPPDEAAETLLNGLNLTATPI